VKVRRRSASFYGAALAVSAALVALAGCGGSVAAMPDRQQMVALYVVDHNGLTPRADTVLVPYSSPFQFVLARCVTNANDLTNLVFAIAEKAADVGGHPVSNLQTLDALASLTTWRSSVPHGCGYIDDVAEAQLENHA
jgi:hypothetical protein